MKVKSLAPHFQIELTKRERMDHMKIMVEASGDGNAQEGAAQLAILVKETIGVTVEVQAGEENSVPRSQGKAVRVIDNRNKS